jgi:hypothetical protein
MIPFTTNTDEIVEQRLQAKACEYVGSVIIYYSPSKKINGIRISMISNASITYPRHTAQGRQG